MTPAMAVPPAEFTPFLLQQVGLRASLLQTSFGFAADDWDDLRQDLALDCIRRLPRFDGSRGTWKGFVRGVVRNHACVLASRQARHPEFYPLEFDAICEAGNGEFPGAAPTVPTEDFRPLLELGVDTERVLTGLPEDPIVNPATGAASRSFVLAGKVDGIVRVGGEYFILEHKSASQIDGDYLEKLWTDFQITIYTYYVEQTMGIPITGILYNVLVKAKLQQGKGETEEEFQARRAELLAKSKTGKTTAKRRLPESDEEFQHRLAEKYADPEMFHREMLYLSRDRFEILRSELWELTQAFLDARRRGIFYQNTAFCFNYQRPCAYFALCRSNGNPNVIENFYQRVPPNEELRSVPNETPEPAF